MTYSRLLTQKKITRFKPIDASFNPLNALSNPICHLLALLGAHHILHVGMIKLNITKDVATDLSRHLVRRVCLMGKSAY